MLTALVMAGVETERSNAQASKVGELSNLNAWVDMMLPRPASIHVTGMITAPTPCYDALAEFVGVANSNSPIYLVKVTLRELPVTCIEVLTNIPFSYERRDYQGNAAKMTIFSVTDSKTVPIENAY